MASLTGKLILTIFALKLIRANAMLYKVRDFVNAGILKSIYHALFEGIFIMHVLYGDRMYTQSINFSYITSKESIKTDSF